MIEKEIEKMSKDEKNLLLYFETCLVDNAGRVNSRRMNKIDFEIAKKWTDEQFIEFKRLLMCEIVLRGLQTEDHKVTFTEKTLVIAHLLRKARALRHNPFLEVKT